MATLKEVLWFSHTTRKLLPSKATAGAFWSRLFTEMGRATVSSTWPSTARTRVP
jgi:hypothetical protein